RRRSGVAVVDGADRVVRASRGERVRDEGDGQRESRQQRGTWGHASMLSIAQPDVRYLSMTSSARASTVDRRPHWPGGEVSPHQLGVFTTATSGVRRKRGNSRPIFAKTDAGVISMRSQSLTRRVSNLLAGIR